MRAIKDERPKRWWTVLNQQPLAARHPHSHHRCCRRRPVPAGRDWCRHGGRCRRLQSSSSSSQSSSSSRSWSTPPPPPPVRQRHSPTDGRAGGRRRPFEYAKEIKTVCRAMRWDGVWRSRAGWRLRGWQRTDYGFGLRHKRRRVRRRCARPLLHSPAAMHARSRESLKRFGGVAREVRRRRRSKRRRRRRRRRNSAKNAAIVVSAQRVTSAVVDVRSERMAARARPARRRPSLISSPPPSRERRRRGRPDPTAGGGVLFRIGRRRREKYMYRACVCTEKIYKIYMKKKRARKRVKKILYFPTRVFPTSWACPEYRKNCKRPIYYYIILYACVHR